jgi:hypothetical protein
MLRSLWAVLVIVALLHAACVVGVIFKTDPCVERDGLGDSCTSPYVERCSSTVGSLSMNATYFCPKWYSCTTTSNDSLSTISYEFGCESKAGVDIAVFAMLMVAIAGICFGAVDCCLIWAVNLCSNPLTYCALPAGVIVSAVLTAAAFGEYTFSGDMDPVSKSGFVNVDYVFGAGAAAAGTCVLIPTVLCICICPFWTVCLAASSVVVAVLVLVFCGVPTILIVILCVPVIVIAALAYIAYKLYGMFGRDKEDHRISGRHHGDDEEERGTRMKGRGSTRSMNGSSSSRSLNARKSTKNMSGRSSSRSLNGQRSAQSLGGKKSRVSRASMMDHSSDMSDDEDGPPPPPPESDEDYEEEQDNEQVDERDDEDDEDDEEEEEDD